MEKFVYDGDQGLKKLSEEEYLNLFTKEKTDEPSKEEKDGEK